ncbi:MAG: cupin domain-containing protein [bacterium]|jgi:hypothetical protein|tara:strand:+ start:1083 stop:1445 length:363 start_codon:yes stop_codon:yes gene_type:complete
MSSIVVKNFNNADEVRTPDKTKAEVVELGNVTAMKITLEPGWRWSECIKPVVGTESCQKRHVGMLVSGKMKVVNDDGSEAVVSAGDAYVFEPGHDGWVVGDEPAVGYEFEGSTAATYAKS